MSTLDNSTNETSNTIYASIAWTHATDCKQGLIILQVVSKEDLFAISPKGLHWRMKHAKAARQGYIALSKEGIRLGQAKCNPMLRSEL